MAAGEGFEPSHTESESAVLPLHNPAKRKVIIHAFQNLSSIFSRIVRFLSGEVCAGIGGIVRHEQIHARAVASHAERLPVALQKALIHGAGHGLYRRLKPCPVVTACPQVGSGTLCEALTDPLLRRGIGLAQGVREMDIGHQRCGTPAPWRRPADGTAHAPPWRRRAPRENPG